ncbi:MAG TPA: ABC transporter substrate-binding protein, partial [Rubrivivax sp.]|nr:ABC transporter substrate-binding protein [Rubrivivax sp.]
MKFSRRAMLALPLSLSLPAARGQLPTRSQQPVGLALIEGLSGAFANAGEAVFRNLLWAVERINRRGGVRVAGVMRQLLLKRFDSKGTAEEALSMLRAALDQGFAFVLQGNSSATTAALVDAVDKHNSRDPQRRALL